MSPSKAAVMDLCCKRGHMCMRVNIVHVCPRIQMCLDDGLVLKAHESLDSRGVAHRRRFQERRYLPPSAVVLPRGKGIGESGKSSRPHGRLWRRAGPLREPAPDQDFWMGPASFGSHGRLLRLLHLLLFPGPALQSCVPGLQSHFPCQPF